jgi:hypothetical protein
MLMKISLDGRRVYKQGKTFEERIPKAKCPNFLLALTPRKGEI